MIFDPLSHEQLRQVARLQMKDVAKRLAERGIALAVTDAALDYILTESYDAVSIFRFRVISLQLMLVSILELVMSRLWQLGLWCKAYSEMDGKESGY